MKCRFKFSNACNFFISEQKHQVWAAFVLVEIKGTFWLQNQLVLLIFFFGREHYFLDGMWENEAITDFQWRQENANPRVQRSSWKRGNVGLSGCDFPVLFEHQCWILFVFCGLSKCSCFKIYLDSHFVLANLAWPGNTAHRRSFVCHVHISHAKTVLMMQISLIYRQVLFDKVPESYLFGSNLE